MSFLKNLFAFSSQEKQYAFDRAKLVFSGSGIKVLSADPKTETIGTKSFAGKLLIVIPKSSGCACNRNRFRRRVKALFYENEWYRHNKIFIIIVYSRALDLTFDNLKELLTKVFSITPETGL